MIHEHRNGLLSYTELCELIESGVICGVDYEQVNSTSIDIRLGELLRIEGCRLGADNHISLKHRDHMYGVNYSLKQDGDYYMAPGQFLLASSHEMFNLPSNISAEYKLKSSMARIGLEHLNAGWCDAGWHGSVLTLELKNMTNYHHIGLSYMDKIGQLVFFRHDPVPDDKSYAARGRYNMDKTVSGVKK